MSDLVIDRFSPDIAQNNPCHKETCCQHMSKTNAEISYTFPQADKFLFFFA